MFPKSPLKAEWGFVIPCNLSSPSHNSRSNLATRLPRTLTRTLKDLDTHTHTNRSDARLSGIQNIKECFFFYRRGISVKYSRQSVSQRWTAELLDHGRADLRRSCSRDDTADVNPPTKTYYSESCMSLLHRQEGTVEHERRIHCVLLSSETSCHYNKYTY